MLKFRKRRAAAVMNDVGSEALKIRNLLDDPNLQAILASTPVAPTVAQVASCHLDWSRPGQVHRPSFGRRLLARAA